MLASYREPRGFGQKFASRGADEAVAKANDILKAADKDSDGKLNVAEVAQHLGASQAGPANTYARDVVHYHDNDGDGSISTSEFTQNYKEWLQNKGKVASEPIMGRQGESSESDGQDGQDEEGEEGEDDEGDEGGREDL